MEYEQGQNDILAEMQVMNTPLDVNLWTSMLNSSFSSSFDNLCESSFSSFSEIPISISGSFEYSSSCEYPEVADDDAIKAHAHTHSEPVSLSEFKLDKLDIKSESFSDIRFEALNVRSECFSEPNTPSISRRIEDQTSVLNFEQERRSSFDVSKLLGYSQRKAAKMLNLPTSTFSKRWRAATNGRKWPYRTVAKLDRAIETLTRNLPHTDADKIAGVNETLRALTSMRDEESRPVWICV